MDYIMETFPIVKRKDVAAHGEYRTKRVILEIHDEMAEAMRTGEPYAEMDHAVAAAYGWQDLDLGHGFHETQQGVRYTVHEGARREVLTRLLALNH